MEQEQVQNQWIPLPVEEDDDKEEEMQDTTTLEGRKSLHHKKDTTIFTGVTPPSSSFSFSSTPPISNGQNNGVFSASVEEPLILKEEEKEPPIEKEEGVEEIGNVVENGNHENEAVGLGLVAEFVGDAINGEAIHFTTATIDVAASQNSSSVYFDKQQGNENEVNGFKGVENDDGERSVLPESNGEGESEIEVENSDIQNGLLNEVNPNDKVHSSSELLPLHNSSKVQAATAETFGDETSAKANPNLTKEIDQQLEDFNVEAVLEKQETHDLFCPNCKSCITRRVILKKRKRNIPKLDTETKPDESDTKRVNSSSAHDANQSGHAIATSDAGNQGGHAIATSDVGSLLAPADNNEPESEPEVFRCSTCLSFFIALRNGLFPCFADAHEPETSQPLIMPAPNLENPSNVAAPNANWFISLFTKKGEKAREQAVGAASVENSTAGSAEQHHSSSTSTNMQTTIGNGHPEGPLTDRAISNNVKLASDNKPEHGGVNSPNPSSAKLVTIEAGKENDIKSRISSGSEPSDDQKHLNSSVQNNLSSIQPSMQSFSNVMNGSQKVGVDFIDSSVKEPLLTENVKTDVGEKKNDSVDMIKTDMPSVSFPGDRASKRENVPSATAATTEGSLIRKTSQKGVDKSPEIAQNGYSSLVQEAQSPAQTFGSAVIASGTGALESSTSQTADDVPVQSILTEPHTQIDIGEQPRAEMGEPPLKWEILKSIVYGGLLESITSLGIVSSAAGSGAAPLNIIALGFANLIGGLFIIFHNLIDLRNDHSGGDLQQTIIMQEDRYQAQLGRRANFLLHVAVAILSFLIFGAVPILVYGLLIHKNYSAELKLAVLAVTSIICIILLATGKVYTKRPPKSYTTTLLQYVTLALAASGVSYIAGGLIDNLLENFNGPKSGFVLTIPSSGTRSVKPAWMSY